MEKQLRNLLLREDDPFRPSLENRVAYQGKIDTSFFTGLMDRERNSNIFRIVTQEVQRLRNAGEKNVLVLDIGCAYGNHIFMLNTRAGKDKNLDFIGIDLSLDKVKFADSFCSVIPDFENCRFLNCDVEKGLTFRENVFDIILCSDVIEHLENPVGFLREIARITKPGGKIVLTSPLKNSLFKTASSVLNFFTFNLLRKSYYDGKLHSKEIDMEKEPGHGHISEMNLSGYIDSGKAAGLKAVEIIPRMVFSGSLLFDRHLFLASFLLFIEALHKVLRFKTWSHGIQIVFEKGA